MSDQFSFQLATVWPTGHKPALGQAKRAHWECLPRVPARRGRYLAFNKDIANDAASRFPRSVLCKTAHSTAYAAVGYRFARRLNSPRRPAWRIGQALGITSPVRIGVHAHHVPMLRRLGAPDERAQLAEVVMPFVEKAWKDLNAVMLSW